MMEELAQEDEQAGSQEKAKDGEMVAMEAAPPCSVRFRGSGQGVVASARGSASSSRCTAAILEEVGAKSLAKKREEKIIY